MHDAWRRTVLAGLGDPERNPYYARPGHEEIRTEVPQGLFARILEHESTIVAKTTARPRWTEATVGQRSDDGTVLQDGCATIETPNEAVDVHGDIDRIDLVPDTTPTQLVVRDYKTGNVPRQKDTLLGLKFQLPLYALLAEDALEDVEVVGGAYYQVKPPGQVSSRRGQVTSKEMVEWEGAEEVETPLVYRRKPVFETHDAFRDFLKTEVPRRLGEVATGIAAGRFHPTVVDSATAGCDFCDYRQVCDVRHHLRRELIDSIREDEKAVYIPPIAEGCDVESVVEVE